MMPFIRFKTNIQTCADLGFTAFTAPCQIIFRPVRASHGTYGTDPRRSSRLRERFRTLVRVVGRSEA
jgi:hypothetical protein